MNGVGEGGIAFGRDLDGELDGVAVAFGVVGGFLGDVPVVAAVEALDYVDGDWLGFLIGEFYFEVLVEGALGLVDVEVGLAA